MARISLKAYNREIESLVDSGQIDQAIAHCRHILKFYPKHIDTYRLLGKAYLESRRYGDAADILQRVLSSVPEDFVSHVGMSIIREDEGNLDEAIWHMERAFEVQPANNAIQEELRRLYGRRDGLEPPKVRLTRGALARMYAKGDLHQQAISELRAALAEDPERLDLQSLLANVYARAGHRAEAAEICNTLLRKLPYCLEANRVMAEVLASSERVSETHPYLSRVQALDPYAAHLSPTTNTIQKVPEQMISVEKLDWKPGQPVGGAPSQPHWAASLGVAIEGAKSEEETLPEWLTAADEVFSSADKEDEASHEHSILEVSPESEFPWEDTSQSDLTDWLPESKEEAAQPAQEDEIPEWMKEAGWSQLGETDESGEESDSTKGLDESELDLSESDELAEAEIPDWLRAMAPSGGEETLDQEISEEDLSWLPEEPGDQLPDWLEEPAAETELEEPGIADIWQEAETISTSEKEAPEDEIPDWISSDELTAEEEPSVEWLPDLDEQEDIHEEIAEASQMESLVPADVSPIEEDEEEMPAWLRDALADEDVITEPDEGVSEQIEEQAAEELPEWLRSLDIESSVEKETLSEWAIEGDQSEDISQQAIDQYDEDVLEEQAAEPAEEIPEWLQEMQVAKDEVTADTETSKTIESTDEAAQLQEEAKPEVEEQAFDLEDEDASFAWLESLAIKQGAEEAILLTPEERQEKSSEWVREEISAEEDISIQEEPHEEVGAAPGDMEVPGEEEPEWEAQFEEQEEQTEEIGEVESEPIADKSTPGWFAGALAFVGAAELAAKDQEEEPEEQEPPAAEELETEQVAVKHESEEPEEGELEFEQLEAEITEEPPLEEGAVELVEAVVQAEEEPSEQTIEEEDTKPVRVTHPDELEAEAETVPVEVSGKPAETAEELEEPAAVESELEPQEEIPSEEAAQTPAFIMEEEQDEVDADFAWLESLAVKQGADEALLLSPEERQQERPEWLPDASETSVVSEEVGEGEPSAEEATPVDQVEEQVETTVQVSSEEIEAVKQVEDEALAQEAEEAEQPETEEVTPEMPAWLRELVADEEFSKPESAAEEAAIPPFAEEVPETEDVPELPGWLAEVEKEEAREETWTLPESPLRKLNLNEASLSELEKLPDIGFILAQSIVAYRETFGPYREIDDLQNVSGIGPDNIDDLQKYVFIETPQEPEPLPEEDQEAPEAIKQARGLMRENKLDESVEAYMSLINSQRHLNEVIRDLKAATSNYPQSTSIWQALGDAYLRSDKIQQALDAYTKAEELLR